MDEFKRIYAGEVNQASSDEEFFDTSAEVDEVSGATAALHDEVVPVEEEKSFSSIESWNNISMIESDTENISLQSIRKPLPSANDSTSSLPFEETNLSARGINEQNMEHQNEERFLYRRSNSCTDTCAKHRDEVIKYFCKSCDEVACQACITVYHKHCSDLDFIPTFITTENFSFREFESEMNQIQDQLHLNKDKLNANIAKSKHMSRKAIYCLRQQRDGLIKLLDCLEKDFERQVSQIEKDDSQRINLLKEKHMRLENEFSNYARDYADRKNAGNMADAFSLAKKSREKTREIKQGIEEIKAKNSITRYEFKPATEVTEFIQSVKELGIIHEVDSKEKRNIVEEITINMRTGTERNPCKITSLAIISDTYLLAVDYGNSSVKVVDVTSNHLIVTKVIEPAPLDVTIIRDNTSENTGRIVVTIPSAHRIKFMKYSLISPDLFDDDGETKTNGQCRGCCYGNDKLFLTFPEKGKIEIIDLRGALLARITTDTIGKIFEPQFVTMDTEGRQIFVTDRINHSVLGLTLDGKIKVEYTDLDLLEPRGLCATETGSLYVCSFQAQEVHHLTEDLEKVSQVSVANDRHLTPFPFSVAYNERSHVIFVGMFTKDCVRALKLAEI